MMYMEKEWKSLEKEVLFFISKINQIIKFSNDYKYNLNLFVKLKGNLSLRKNKNLARFIKKTYIK
jgi:hypothetical protein